MKINDFIRQSAGILPSDEIAAILGSSRANVAARASRMGLSLKVDGRASSAMIVENARRYPGRVKPEPKEPEPWKQHIPEEVARINKLWRVTSL